MEHFEPNVFLENNEEGIERVKRDVRTFAFFMESSTIDYITQKECNLIKIGDKLDSKSYGIGMPLSICFYFILILNFYRIVLLFVFFFYNLHIYLHSGS